jgi:hypothetical protein
MSDQPPDLVFRVRSSDVEALLMESGGEGSLKPLVTRPAGAAGGGEFANILVPLVSASLGFVAAIATTWIKRPGATVELKNMKVTGASRQTVEALLRRELELPRPMSAGKPRAKSKTAAQRPDRKGKAKGPPKRR